MESVTKRELNQNTAAVLGKATALEDVIVTERGRPRWRIGVVRDDESAVDRLLREGRFTPPATNPTAWPDQVEGPAYTSEQVDALIDEIRGDH